MDNFKKIRKALQENLELSVINESNINPLFATDKDVIAFENKLTRKSSNKDDLKTDLLMLFDKFKPNLDSVHNEFKSMLSTEVRRVDKSGNTKIITNMKPFDSIVSKAVERRKGFSRLNDLVRGAVLFPDKEAADDFVNNIVRKNKSKVIEAESKDFGKDRTYGYFGSHHLLFNINGIIVELQVMTKKLWSYKKSAHDIYNKNRENPKNISRTDQALSRRIFSLGNRPGYVREEVFIEDLAEIFDFENLDEDYFENWEELDLTQYP